MASGGDVKFVSIGAARFAVAGGTSITRDLGGYTTEILPNGDQSARKIYLTKPWMLEGVQLVIDDLQNDQQTLQDKIDGIDGDANGNHPIVMETVSGATFQAVGTVSGDLKADTASATATVTLAGPGKMTKQ